MPPEPTEQSKAEQNEAIAKSLNDAFKRELEKSLKYNQPLPFFLIPLANDAGPDTYVFTGRVKNFTKGNAEKIVKEALNDAFRLTDYAQGEVRVRNALKGEPGVSKDAQSLWLDVSKTIGTRWSNLLNQQTFLKDTVFPALKGLYMLSLKLRIQDEKGHSRVATLKVQTFQSVTVTQRTPEKEIVANEAKLTARSMAAKQAILAGELAKGQASPEAQIAALLKSRHASVKRIIAELAALSARWRSLRIELEHSKIEAYQALAVVLGAQIKTYIQSVEAAIKSSDAKKLLEARTKLEAFIAEPQGAELDRAIQLTPTKDRLVALFAQIQA